MGILTGEYAVVDSAGDAVPTNGATITLWHDNSSFQAGGVDGVATYPPIAGTAVPSTTVNRVTSPATTGTAHGGKGEWRFTGLTSGSYWVSHEYSDQDTVWTHRELTNINSDGDITLRGDSATLVYIKGSNVAYTDAWVYTVPDAGASASFVMTAGTQTVAGNKTFSGNNIHSGTADFSSTVDLNSTTGGLRLPAAAANCIHGTGQLASGATTTTINNTAIKTGARVILIAAGANFWARDPFVSTITDSTSFILTHLNQANAPFFAYWIINPVA